MTKRAPQNIPASIHQRLLNIAKNTNRPFNEVLQYYAIERFLYRLSRSEHSHAFVLKGALLFRIWNIPDTRATKDIDFLAYMENTPKHLAQVIRDTCAIEHPEDGLIFDPDSVDAQLIKKDAEYEGVRILFRGQLGTARVTMQVDVGFGDVIHPSATQADYPTLLDLPGPVLQIYARETVIAEKAQAMVNLGNLNSRLKDFYDIWRMSRQFDFDGRTLSEAVRGTFDNRGTTIIEFDELADELRKNENMDKQWRAFRQKTQVEGPDSFTDLLLPIGEFLSPVFSAVRTNKHLRQKWTAPGPWRITQRFP